MKVLLAIALLSTCVFAAQAGPGRRLSQLSAISPSSSSSLNCEGQATVFDVAEENGLNLFLEAAIQDDLQSSLDNSSSYPLQYTVFAPTDDAIQGLLTQLGTTLEDLRDSGDLDDILQYHFLITPYTAGTLENLGTVATNFRNSTLSFSDGGVITAYGSNATIITPDIPACETIVHIIDNVLVPNFDAVAPPEGAPASASS